MSTVKSGGSDPAYEELGRKGRLIGAQLDRLESQQGAQGGGEGKTESFGRIDRSPRLWER